MINKRNYVITELMVPGFIEQTGSHIVLYETEDTGRSKLDVFLSSDQNLCIKNVDKKNTQFYFFQDTKVKSMFKRVDHIIFENVAENDWKLLLIEMKSGIHYQKWVEVKGKFRASYLFAQAVAAILEMNIIESCMYTTYEKADFRIPDTMLVARRPSVGMRSVNPQEEWNGEQFALNFGLRIPFRHQPVLMTRNSENMLLGILQNTVEPES